MVVSFPFVIIFLHHPAVVELDLHTLPDGLDLIPMEVVVEFQLEVMLV